MEKVTTCEDKLKRLKIANYAVWSTTSKCSCPISFPYLCKLYVFLSAPKVLFPDDTCVFYSDKNTKLFKKVRNNVPDNVESCLKAKKMILNVKKSNLILFNIQENSQSISDPNRISIGND